MFSKFEQDLDINTIYMATGENFPDALAGSVLAAKTASPIILTAKDPEAITKKFMGDKLPSSIKNWRTLGGEGAVSSETLTKIYTTSDASDTSDASNASKKAFILAPSREGTEMLFPLIGKLGYGNCSGSSQIDESELDQYDVIIWVKEPAPGYQPPQYIMDLFLTIGGDDANFCAVKKSGDKTLVKIKVSSQANLSEIVNRIDDFNEEKYTPYNDLDSAPANSSGLPSSPTIDYNDPSKYTTQGKQSAISDTDFQAIDQKLGIKTKTLNDIAHIYSWKHQAFKNVSGGGQYVGKMTVSKILQKKQLTGCHDHGLLLASVLRQYGFPAVMVDATGIQFSLDYPNTNYFSGHVFVEVYVNGNWILLDSNSGEYVLNYDPSNPILPITKKGVESKGYYVMYKGLDPEGYGITDIKRLNKTMIQYADLIKGKKLDYPDYQINQFRF